jgi:hypothetical protein
MPGKSAYFGSAIVILFTRSPSQIISVYVWSVNMPWFYAHIIHTYHGSVRDMYKTRKLALVQIDDPWADKIPERRSNWQILNTADVIDEHPGETSMDPWKVYVQCTRICVYWKNEKCWFMKFLIKLIYILYSENNFTWTVLYLLKYK